MNRHQPLTSQAHAQEEPVAPIDRVREPPSFAARCSCVGILMGAFAVWGRWAFIPEEASPGRQPIHSMVVPIGLTVFYLVSLPLLQRFRDHYLENVDVKLLLRESMIIYNGAQVLLNAWVVYRIVDALVCGRLDFMGGNPTLDLSGASFAVWIHYCDKYLEYLDTYFMVLRGKMDQVSFLHIYHHASIAIAWWIGIRLHPGGDIYFGALINSWIHVMMYSYYTLSLLRIQCPWKKYLTMAQLTQFVSVLAFSGCSILKFSQTPPSERLTTTSWKVYTCHLVQDFEMLSLFVLFMHFYRKAYNSRRKSLREKTSADSATTTSDSLSQEEGEQESISSVCSTEEE